MARGAGGGVRQRDAPEHFTRRPSSACSSSNFQLACVTVTVHGVRKASLPCRVDKCAPKRQWLLSLIAALLAPATPASRCSRRRRPHQSRATKPRRRHRSAASILRRAVRHNLAAVDDDGARTDRLTFKEYASRKDRLLLAHAPDNDGLRASDSGPGRPSVRRESECPDRESPTARSRCDGGTFESVSTLW